GAAFLPAAGTGLGPVPHADQEPLHVRISHPSGWRHHGGTGAAGGTGNPQRLQGSSLGRCPKKRTRLRTAISSSLAADTTGSSLPSTWPRLDTSPWCS